MEAAARYYGVALGGRGPVPDLADEPGRGRSYGDTKYRRDDNIPMKLMYMSLCKWAGLASSVAIFPQ